MFEKIWEQHEVRPELIYIDLHLVHEVTSPQAFDGLRLAGRTVRRPDRTMATADHNIPTDGATTLAQIKDALSRKQIEVLENNCAEFGVPVHSIGSDHQGIVHVIGPELGITQPGMTIVCGDSHTATHGAFGALAFGIGTAEVEHVLATQTLGQRKPKSMRINYTGELGFGVTPKDLILATIGQMGVDGAVGYVVEYAGPVVENMTMEGRMTMCNMTIEGGGRAGLIAPDETTFEWVEGREAAPTATTSTPRSRVEQPRHRRRRHLRQGGRRSTHRRFAAGQLGHDAEHGHAVTNDVPAPLSSRPTDRDERALEYMGLEAGHADHGDQARPRLHRLVHQQPHRRSAHRRRSRQGPQGRRHAERDGRAGIRSGQGCRPKRKVSTRSSSTPDSTGAAPAARCAWA